MAKGKKVEEVIDEEVDVDEVEVDDEVEEAEETTETLSAKAVATMLGTDGRTFRKYLRSIKGRVGQGNRWVIDADEVEELRKGFAAFNKPKAPEAKVLLAPADAELDEVDFDDLIDDEALEIEDLDEIEIG